jgi:hypothetical protein
MQYGIYNKKTPHIEINVTLDNYKELLGIIKHLHEINALSEYSFDLLETNFQRRYLDLCFPEKLTT